MHIYIYIYIFHHLLSMLSISIKKEKIKDSMLSIYLSFPLDIYISGLWSVVSKGFAITDVLLYSILFVEFSCSYKRIEMKRLG